MSAGPAIVIVGAGPAGMAAARLLAEHGLRPLVVDRAPAPGGQIWRAPGVGELDRALPGHDPEIAARARESFLELARRGAIDWYPLTTVVDLTRDRLWALGPSAEVDSTGFDRLVLCPGAMERILPFPGWTLPGVYTVGGAQAVLKSRGCAVGRRLAFVGTGPLLYLAAAQHVAVGVEVAVIAETSALTASLAALPGLAADRSRLALGLRCLRLLRAAGVPIVRGVRRIEVQGGEGVEALRIESRGAVRTIPCDAVAQSFGLAPQIQLFDLLDCPFRLDPESGVWAPEVDGTGRTALAGVYAAGDGAAVLGGAAAVLAGERAAWALLEDLARPIDRARVHALERALQRHRRFARGLARAFPFPAELEAGIDDGTIVCRCEGVTAGTLRTAVRELDADEVNRLKAFTRCGMGRCQGRLCGPTAARLLAAARGCPLAAAGRLRFQAPIEPLPARVRQAAGEDAA